MTIWIQAHNRFIKTKGQQCSKRKVVIAGVIKHKDKETDKP